VNLEIFVTDKSSTETTVKGANPYLLHSLYPFVQCLGLTYQCISLTVMFPEPIHQHFGIIQDILYGACHDDHLDCYRLAGTKLKIDQLKHL
jgi:hypothetical protein